MHSVTRKSLLILLGIGLVEAVPYLITLHRSSVQGIERLYAFDLTIWPAWLGAAVVTIAYVAHAIRSFPMVRAHFFDPHPLELAAIHSALVAGTMEEIWFRRLVMDGVAHRGGSALLQVTASAHCSVPSIYSRTANWRRASGRTSPSTWRSNRG